MVAIFLDGESKSGKTAVGRHMRAVLEKDDHRVRLVVAGNFFRTVALVTLRRGFDKNSEESLAQAVKAALGSAELYEEVNEAELQTPDIDTWVSRIAQFYFVQAAAQDWRIQSAQKALDDGIDVVLLDGRNLRAKLSEWLQETDVPVVLELIIFCTAEVAARRYLGDAGNSSPGVEQLDAATAMINERREMDRNRTEAAYQDAVDPVILRPGEVSAQDAYHDAFLPGVVNPPRPIIFDNSEVPLAAGLATVGELAQQVIDQVRLES